MRQIAAGFGLLLALGFAAPVFAAPATPAQSVAPDVLLRSVMQEVIARIQMDTDLQAGNPLRLAALVESMVLPLFDFDRMTQSAMARNWRLASPAQQTVLVSEFRTLLVRTYSSALANYHGEVIEFKRMRAAPGDSEVTVKSDVKRGGAEKMSLDYDMENTPAGWKIYDVRVAGVRLVSSYRDAFADKVREGGVDGLITSLSDMNREGNSRFNSVKPSFWEKSRLFYAIFRGMFERPR